jgi:hypothetical protein
MQKKQTSTDAESDRPNLTQKEASAPIRKWPVSPLNHWPGLEGAKPKAQTSNVKQIRVRHVSQSPCLLSSH